MGKDPMIKEATFGTVTVDKNTYEKDIYILSDGQIKRRQKSLAKKIYGTSHKIGPAELKILCKGHPRTIFIGTSHSGLVELTEEGQKYLAEHRVEVQALSTPEVVEALTQCENNKAALLHVTC